ncbi:unnamed protein product [Knipowitschia caucasica]|uniref:fructose-2,6-bisphosphate 2-phosphatase n=1 Tax=Knipowitschia caucasica TaxID=637954 RepID=A0AAV2ITI9_KNICA
MPTFSLTLIRHGETQYNRDKLLQGQGVDTLLSEAGALQGQAVGQYLRDIPFNYVFVSNLQRAVQTAELILRNNTHCSSVKMVLEPLLREKSFGIAEGRPKESLKNMANAAGQSCRDFTPPGGETFDQVKTRFKKFLSVLIHQLAEPKTLELSEQEAAATSKSGDDPDSAPWGSPVDGLEGVSVHVLVVSHGAYIRIAIKHMIDDLNCSLPYGAKMSQVFSPCPNTGITRFLITLEPSESGPVLSAAQCVFVNRQDHLQNMEAVKLL